MTAVCPQQVCQPRTCKHDLIWKRDHHMGVKRSWDEVTGIWVNSKSNDMESFQEDRGSPTKTAELTSVSRVWQASEAEGQSRESIVPNTEQHCLPFPLLSCPSPSFLPLLSLAFSCHRSCCVSWLKSCLSVNSYLVTLTGWYRQKFMSHLVPQLLNPKETYRGLY